MLKICIETYGENPVDNLTNENHNLLPKFWSSVCFKIQSSLNKKEAPLDKCALNISASKLRTINSDPSSEIHKLNYSGYMRKRKWTNIFKNSERG